MPFLTPYTEGGLTTRPLRIPNEFLPIVGGLLAELLDSWNWELFGDLTVEDCVAMAQSMIDDYYNQRFGMIGEIKQLATADIPDNCLLCDGTEYLRVDYPSLYAVIDTVFITDADHFITPPIVDRVVVGAGNTYDTGDTFGESEHTLLNNEMPPHDHTIQNGYGPDFQASTSGGVSPESVILPTEETTSSTGGGEAHNNLQPSIALPVVIVAR